LPNYPYDSSKIIMKKYKCNMCGWIYDETKGVPDEGINPGTRWEDIPNDWVCPLCGSGKEDFDMVEI
jgi:rubredoxin